MRQLFPSILVGSLLAACASRGAAPETSSAPASRGHLLPPPSGPLELPAGEHALSLEEMLARLTQLTGVTFSIDAPTRALLKQGQVALSATTRVPADDVYPWAEAILQQHGYALGMLSNGERPLLGVYAANVQRASQPSPLEVPIEQIAECRRHPALLVTTVLTLPDVDVRTVANSMRGMASDPAGNQGIMPVGNTHSLVLMGSGRNVADLVSVLTNVQTAARKTTVPDSTATAK